MSLDTTLGVTQLGQYRLLRRLAVGGMAELFVAVLRGAGRFSKPVAIKRILPGLAAEPQFVEMFFEEARLAASLDHPHIAKVLDFGEEGRLPYIVMEFVHGVDLRVLLKALRGPLPAETAVTIAVQLGEALHYVHEHRDVQTGKSLGLVHRDVSPSNVLLGYAGGVKLTDFGIVKATEATAHTATGALKGKLAYLSPEQARCERVDRRTDVYAMGLVLFELTTGRRMHRAVSEVGLLARVCDGEYVPPSAVAPDFDGGLEQILKCALEPDADKRYATCQAFVSALEQLAVERRWTRSTGELSDFLARTIADPGPVVAPAGAHGSVPPAVEPSRTITRAQRWKSRGRQFAVGGVLVGLAAGVAVGPALFAPDESARLEQPEPLGETSVPVEIPASSQAAAAAKQSGVVVAADEARLQPPSEDAAGERSPEGEITSPNADKPHRRTTKTRSRSKPSKRGKRGKKAPQSDGPNLHKTLLPPSQR